MADLTPVSSGIIRGTFVAGVLDSADPGGEPDIVPMTGQVVISATTPYFRVTTTDPPMTVFPTTLTIPLNAEGRLEYNGSTDIALWATTDPDTNPTDWQWRVAFELQFNGQDVAYPSFNFTLDAAEVVDLTTAAPAATPSPGVAITQGPPGEDGLSAYEVAVLEGFVGDEAAWLASLEGDPGPPGSGATAYANMAAVDAVEETEVGIATLADIGTDLGIASMTGESGDVLVETLVTLATTYSGAIQFARVSNPDGGSHIERARTRYTTGGVWGAWTAWYDRGYPVATDSAFGTTRYATSAETQTMTSTTRTVTPGGLAAAATTSSSPNRLMRRDASGRSQVATPNAANDAANKAYVDSIAVRQLIPGTGGTGIDATSLAEGLWGVLYLASTSLYAFLGNLAGWEDFNLSNERFPVRMTSSYKDLGGGSYGGTSEQRLWAVKDDGTTMEARRVRHYTGSSWGAWGAWETVVAPEVAPVRYAINAQTGTTYTPVLSDENKLVTLTNAGAITVTLPSDADVAIPVGGSITFAVRGAGMATFVAGTGVSPIEATPTAVTRAQYSTVQAIKVAANTWMVVGDLAS